jgi:hypothetical protein
VTETITIRLRRPKRELQAKAKPNVNSWVNDLIDRALGPQEAQSADWDAHFARRRTRKPAHYRSDEIRRTSR